MHFMTSTDQLSNIPVEAVQYSCLGTPHGRDIFDNLHTWMDLEMYKNLFDMQYSYTMN